MPNLEIRELVSKNRGQLQWDSGGSAMILVLDFVSVVLVQGLPPVPLGQDSTGFSLGGFSSVQSLSRVRLFAIP